MTKPITIIITIIIVSLLIWEYGIPYFDDSINTPSDYIRESLFSENSDGVFYYQMVDVSTGKKVDLLTPSSTGSTFYYTQMESYHEYAVYVVFELNPSIMGSFRTTWEYRMIDENGTISPVYPMGVDIAGWQPLFTNKARIDINFTLNYENEYSTLLYARFYNQDGVRMVYKGMNSVSDNICVYFQGSAIAKQTGVFYN